MWGRSGMSSAPWVGCVLWVETRLKQNRNLLLTVVTEMIRKAHIDDAEAIQEVVEQAYQGYVERLGMKPGPMQDDYREVIRSSLVFVVSDGLAIAGVLVLKSADKGLLLENIAVRPDMQGKGVGRMLLEKAEHEALARGLESLSLYTHQKMTENISLYRRIGYRETTRVREHGFDRVYMRKQLAKLPG